MNSDDVAVKRGSPLCASTDVDSDTTRAPEPLSKIPVTTLVVRTDPSTGIGAESSIDCSPWTSMARSIEPRMERGGPPPPTTAANVGRTRCGRSVEFSVVYSNSKSTASSEPAPTPRAYRRQSVDDHDRSRGVEVAPTASRLMGMAVLQA